MPNRILRDGIISSPRVAQLSWPAEVFYRRLMSVVDDYGRHHAHPMLLRAACYPMQLDRVSDADVADWLREAEKAGLIKVYRVAGHAYLEVLDFRQQVRAKKSKFPEPPSDDQQVPSICVADAKQVQSNAHLDEGEVEDGGGADQQKRRTLKTRMPADFAISDRVRTWAEKNGVVNLESHFEVFVSKARAKGYTYANWDEGFMGAIRDDWAKIGKGTPAEKRLVI